MVALSMALLFGGAALGELSSVIHHQGLVAVDGEPYSGNGAFRFALVDSQTNLNVWTNDGSSVGVSDMPVLPVELTATNGLYEAGLGDTSLSNMVAIPPSLFANESLALRVWFDDGFNGIQQFAPDHAVSAVPYALQSANANRAAAADTLQGQTAADLDESGEIDTAITNHAAVAAAHHAKTVDASELSQGTLDNARLSANVTLLGADIDLETETTGILPEEMVDDNLTRDKELGDTIDVHAAIADAHHTKTTDAAELTQGVLDIARFPEAVSLLGATIESNEIEGPLVDNQIPSLIARDSEVELTVGNHNLNPNAHAALQLDAAQIVSGILSNSLLNMGPGSGLNADTVDGLHAGAFMSSTADSWVNTSGDAMYSSTTTPTLEISNSGVGTILTGYAYGSALYAQSTGSGAVAVEGKSTSTSGTANYGGKFAAASTTGRGVYGLASNTGASTNYGGYFSAAGTSGVGVHGDTSGTNGKAADFTASGSGNAVGVQAYASSTAAVTNHGGYFTAAGETGRGVYGRASNSAGGTNYGGYFEASGTTGIGAYGKTATGTAGVRGENTNTSTTGNYYGVYGSTDSTSYYAAGVYGAGDKQGVWGQVPTSGYGVRGSCNGTGSGVHGFSSSGYGVSASGASGWAFYAVSGGLGDYGPFTGAHEVKLAADFPAECVPGLVLSATGETQVRTGEGGAVKLSSTLPTARLADTPNDKAVFGVLVAEATLPAEHWYKPASGERFASANALGEGRVWVTNVNGNIGLGDYITTSSVPGYGQLQDDDLLHNYTLGKVTEAVDWDAVTETVELNGQTYKAHLIAIIYVSG